MNENPLTAAQVAEQRRHRRARGGIAIAATAVTTSAGITINGVEAYDMTGDLDPLVPGEPQLVPLAVEQTGDGAVYISLESANASDAALLDEVHFVMRDGINGQALSGGTLSQFDSNGGDVAIPVEMLPAPALAGGGPQPFDLELTLNEDADPSLIGAQTDTTLVLTIQ